MKNTRKTLLALMLALTCGAYTSMAQVYVRTRPHRPHYERTASPGPHHVWIGEDWEPNGNSYTFVGGHWAEPPQGHTKWHGRWKHTSHGNIWIKGSWR